MWIENDVVECRKMPHDDYAARGGTLDFIRISDSYSTDWQLKRGEISIT